MMPEEPALATLQNSFARYFAATRPAFLAASLMACMIGLVISWHDSVAFNTLRAFITVLFAMLAHAGVNVLNDYYDALNGTDELNTERIFPYTGGSRFIQNGVLSKEQTRNFGALLMVVVMLAGLWLMSVSNWQLFYIGFAGLLIGWAYSAPPLRLDSRGLGEFCVASGFLAITVGSDFVQRGGFFAAPFIVGLSYALLVADLLYMCQFPDRTADKAVGKLHWVARLDLRQARWGYVLIAALAYGWLPFCVILGWLPGLVLLAWLALPLTVQASRLLFRHADHPGLLGDAIKLTIGAMLAHGALLCTALLITK